MLSEKKQTSSHASNSNNTMISMDRSTITDSSLGARNQPEEQAGPNLFDLDNDSLALILEYTDYVSCNRFTKCLSHKYRQRCAALISGWLGDRIFERHGFSPENSLGSGRAEHECKLRKQLDQVLLSSRWSKQNPFPLRHGCFGFVPVLPDDEDFTMDDDPPPVSFECDSFWLTSSGTSGELLFLNPFSTKLSVLGNILEHVAGFDVTKARSDSKDGTTTMTNPTTWQPPTPKQTLFDTSDYFDVDLRHYFPTTRNDPLNDTNEEQEFELSYIGVEAKPLLTKDSSGSIIPHGTMVAVGRILSREDNEDAHPFQRHGINREDTWHCVTELTSWFRNNSVPIEENYSDQHVCRFPGGFRTLDVCANTRCVYVNPWISGDNEWMGDRDLDQPITGQEQVLVYPMMKKLNNAAAAPFLTTTTKSLEYFPSPIAILNCQEAVTALKVLPLGDQLLVATIKGNVQLWNMVEQRKPRLVHTFLCFEGIRSAYQKAGRSGFASHSEEAVGALRSVPPNHPSAVEEIYVARHIPIDRAGFVTLQHSTTHGSTLMLWKCVEDEWRIQALIDLPLSASRFPKIHFDGRKIIVLGQDHIGYLLLIYQVAYSNEYLGDFTTMEQIQPGRPSCGGVVNFGSSPHVRFAKRIRHAALGGLQGYDPLHMTCNERYIVVATKTGHFVESHQFFAEGDDGKTVHSFNEGLLVIDLFEQLKSPDT